MAYTNNPFYWYLCPTGNRREEELKDFRKLMSNLKAKNAKKTQPLNKKRKLEPELMNYHTLQLA